MIIKLNKDAGRGEIATNPCDNFSVLRGLMAHHFLFISMISKLESLRSNLMRRLINDRSNLDGSNETFFEPLLHIHNQKPYFHQKVKSYD